MDTVGLLAAMPSESQALISKVKGTKFGQSGAFKVTRFTIGIHDCILVTSGIGVKRAEEAAEWLIRTHQPDCLISFGIAGAVQADLRIGDVILATRNSSLEDDGLTPLMSLAQPSSEVWNAIHEDLKNHFIRAMHGSVITTSGSQTTNCPPEWEHPVLEMETAGILRAARVQKIPLMVLRSISDGPNEPIPIDLGEVMDGNGSLHAGRLLRTVLKHPGILLKAGPMLKNSRIAADHAARAVMAVLQQGGPSILPLEKT